MDDAGMARAVDADSAAGAVLDTAATDDASTGSRPVSQPVTESHAYSHADGAPARTVAAIVVTTEPSPELASTLRALTRQDVPVAVLVVDDSSAQDPTSIVADAAPDAFVARLDAVGGWCAAANHGADLVSGATWLLICHDDVAPAPDALRSMLDTAIDQQADLVVPKLVAWNDHERLRSVGFSADRSAKAISRVDPDELDQGQHDFVRSTVAAHSACLLVNAAAFARVGGFDAVMSAPSTRSARSSARSRRTTSPAEQLRLGAAVTGPERGEDLDLCWRIIDSGGKAVVDPNARVAHAERRHRSPDSDVDPRPRDPAGDALATLIGRRNRIRTVCSVLHGTALLRGLAGLLFQRIALLGSDLPLPAVRALVPRTGVRALLRRRSEVAASRTKGQSGQPGKARLRTASRPLDGQLSPGDVTLRRAVRDEFAKDSSQALLLAGDAVAAGWKRGPVRLISGLFVVIISALIIGSRHLLGGVAPHGQFVPIAPLGDVLRAYSSTWRDVGTGAVAPSPPGLLVAVLARIAGVGTNGLTGLLTTTALLPIGVIGAARLGAAVARSCRERVAPADAADRRSADQSTGVLSTALCAALYGAAPVAANAIRVGSWEALLLYATLPWLLHSILSVTGQVTTRHRTEGDRPSVRSAIVRVGLPLGLVTSLSVAAGVVALVATLALWVGSRIADAEPMTEQERRGPARSLGLIAAAAGCALVLMGGWSTEIIRTPTLLRGHGPMFGPVDLGQIVRLTAGPTPDGPVGLGGWIGVGLLVAAVLTMLLVNGRRLWWAVNWWTMACVFAAAMWAVDRGPVVGILPSHELLAVPLALGLVLVVTIGLSGIAQDIIRASFGWRQVAMITAVVAALATALPVVWTARHGNWRSTESNARRATQWIPDTTDEGLFRTLWIGTPDAVDGDPHVLPGQTARPSAERVRWNLSGVGAPTITSSWGGQPRAATLTVGQAVADAASRSTFRLGAQLAPAAVRYVVLTGDVARAVDAGAGSPAAAVGPLATVAEGLEQQLDLREVQRDRNTVVYENMMWALRRAVDGRPVFVGGGSASAVSGQIPAGTLRIAETADQGWQLTVDGAAVKAVTAVAASTAGGTGVADRVGVAFQQAGGRATLRHDSPLIWTLLRWAQIVLWCALTVAFLLDWSNRRRRLDDLVAELHPDDDEGIDDDADAWDTSLTVAGAFRSDDDVYAEMFDEPVHPGRRGPATGGDPATGVLVDPSSRVAVANDELAVDLTERDPMAGESLADQLWSEWSTRHGRGQAAAPGDLDDGDEPEPRREKDRRPGRAPGEQRTDGRGPRRRS